MKRSVIVLAFLLMIHPRSFAGPTTYATIIDSNDLAEFGTLNLSTGAFTEIGSPSSYFFGGLASYGNGFYTSGQNGLAKIDPLTGAVTPIGNQSLITVAETHNGKLYTYDPVNGLSTVSPSTGATTAVGPSNLSPQYIFDFDVAAKNNSLYLAYATGPTLASYPSGLYSINTNTGAATLVGPTGFDLVDTIGFAGGTLYGFALDGYYSGGEDILTIDPTTGVGTATGVHLSDFYVTGLSDLTAVPEPNTFVLAAVMAVAAVSYRLRKKP